MTEFESVNTPTSGSALIDEVSQLEVKLVSKLPLKYQLPVEKIVIAGSLSRMELSELVNDSLTLEVRIPFDFLINGSFLRGSLGGHINDFGILSEKTLEIEYVIAMEELKSSDLTDPQPAWISGISVHGNHFYTCSMNGGVARHVADTGKQVCSNLHGSLPLVGISVTSNGVVVTASRDGAIRFSDCDTLEAFQTGKVDDSNSFQCLAVCPFDETLMVTGSTTGDLYLWNIPTRDLGNKGKKRSAPAHVSPRMALECSSVSGISAIRWLSLTRIIVASLDGSIQVIDPLSNQALPTIQTNRPISALACLNDSMLVTGHADGRVIFWTLRSDSVSASIEAVNSCRSHTRMISCLETRPNDEYVVVSGSIDGSIKVLDCRASQFAIQSVSMPPTERVLATCWNGSNQLFSGASDGIVRSHVIPLQESE